MKLLFDQGTLAPLRHHLPGHTVDTPAEKEWSDKDIAEAVATMRPGEVVELPIWHP